MIACDLTLLAIGLSFGVVYGLNTTSEILDLVRINLIR